MACVIYCSGNDARYIPPEKEAFYPGPLSIYSRFWVAGSPWQLLLSPGWGPGPATDRVPPVPGIYELAISRKPAPNALVTVYVGKSSNLRARQQQYLRDGDHLASLVHAILEEGCCIWYRYRVLKSDLQAQRWEARFLLDYDYAWNAMLNPPKRMIYLEPLPCCCVSVGTSAIAWKTGGRIQNSPVLSGQLRSCLYIGWNVSLVIEIIVGVAIICIVALQLTKSTNAGSQCLLGNHDYSRNRLCIYSYIVAGSGIVAASTLVILLAVLGNRCFCLWTSASVETVVSASMFVWWAIASMVFTVISSHTSGSTPSQPWNVSVIVLSWLTTLLWGISWFIVIFPNFLSSVSRPRRQRLEPSDSHNMNTRPLVPQTSPDLRVRVGNGQMTPTRPTAPPAPYTMSSEINGHVNNDMPTYTIV